MHAITYGGQHVWVAAGDTLKAVYPTRGEAVRSIDVAARAGPGELIMNRLCRLAPSEKWKVVTGL